MIVIAILVCVSNFVSSVETNFMLHRTVSEGLLGCGSCRILCTSSVTPLERWTIHDFSVLSFATK